MLIQTKALYQARKERNYLINCLLYLYKKKKNYLLYSKNKFEISYN